MRIRGVEPRLARPSTWCLCRWARSALWSPAGLNRALLDFTQVLRRLSLATSGLPQPHCAAGLVARTGFEPASSALREQCPRQLDQRAIRELVLAATTWVGRRGRAPENRTRYLLNPNQAG